MSAGPLKDGEAGPHPAAGPWIAVKEREPALGAVVLAKWEDGAVRTVEWSPSENAGVIDRSGGMDHHRSIFVAHTNELVWGIKTWPTHWAELPVPHR